MKRNRLLTKISLVIMSGFFMSSQSPGDEQYGYKTMHGDLYASDTSHISGPSLDNAKTQFKALKAACPTVLSSNSHLVFAICTRFLKRQPMVYLFLPESIKPAAELPFEGGSLLGNIYGFINMNNQLVVVDGNQRMHWIDARKEVNKWSLIISRTFDISPHINLYCQSLKCGKIVSINPDSNGRIWFSTERSLAGYFDPETERVEMIQTSSEEIVANSISSSRNGKVAVVSNKSLHILSRDDSGHVRIDWSEDYQRGPAQKPGQLSYGSGATPTFFGPPEEEFVMITDNDAPKMSLLVFRTDLSDQNEERLVCKVPLFQNDNSGTENSAIGINRSIIVSSTYGYAYPAYPNQEDESESLHGPSFIGGIARIDINETHSDCQIVWENRIKSAAVPKLSIADSLIYTTELRSSKFLPLKIFDRYYFSAIDFDTGRLVKKVRVKSGIFGNTLQMAGDFVTDGVFFQGTLGGIVRISD